MLQLVVPGVARGVDGRVDFAWREQRVVGEFDGRVRCGRLLAPGQEAGAAVFAEKVREDAIRAAGWTVLRWTWGSCGSSGRSPPASAASSTVDRTSHTRRCVARAVDRVCDALHRCGTGSERVCGAGMGVGPGGAGVPCRSGIGRADAPRTAATRCDSRHLIGTGPSDLRRCSHSPDRSVLQSPGTATSVPRR
ncbi:hypothetical protein GCM10010472_33320 [Pseudonocardia halophobica]|uniref:Uncharacterized protein n=1 Tax=Pseudonocardia halophobica TaxID=29401 RepID=A0A9W6L7I7_9PSEU|nr:hypothetical protein GCM10017577_36600 [Pseudonocardia halophobica]